MSIFVVNDVVLYTYKKIFSYYSVESLVHQYKLALETETTKIKPLKGIFFQR